MGPLHKWRLMPCGLSSLGKKCSHKREMDECARASLASRFSLPAHNRLLSLAGETRDEEEGGMELMIAR